MIRSLHRETRQKQILDVALELFREKGFEGTPMSAIAEEVGISKAGLYHHFETKSALLRALIEPLFGKVAALVERAPGRRELLEEYLEILLENRYLVALIGNDLSTLARPEIGPRAKELNDGLLDLVAGSAVASEGRIQAEYALGGLRSAVVRFSKAEPETIRRAVLEAAARTLGR